MEEKSPLPLSPIQTVQWPRATVANRAFPATVKLEQKQSFGYPTGFAFHLQHPVNIYHLFSVFLLVSESSGLCPISESQCFCLSGLSFR